MITDLCRRDSSPQGRMQGSLVVPGNNLPSLRSFWSSTIVAVDFLPALASPISSSFALWPIEPNWSSEEMRLFSQKSKHYPTFSSRIIKPHAIPEPSFAEKRGSHTLHQLTDGRM